MIAIIIVVLLLALLLSGGVTAPRYGAAGWSPVAIVLIVLLVLWLAGVLR